MLSHFKGSSATSRSITPVHSDQKDTTGERALLRVTEGKCLRLRAHELAAQRFVATPSPRDHL